VRCWIGKLWGRLMSALFPWPTRSERKEAIRRARHEKERSRAAAASATAIRRDIERMAQANHFAELIAASLTQGRHHKGPAE
jgi:hypothetical protein